METLASSASRSGLNIHPVARRTALTSSQFEAEFLRGSFHPVILEDAMDQWAAKTKWTFEFFATRYGHDHVVVTNRLSGATKGFRTSLRDFIAYCGEPGLSTLGRVETPTPFYLTNYSPMSFHPELLDDFSHPHCIQNSFLELRDEARNWYFDNFSWLFIGPKGTFSPLHTDLFGTHAWLSQIHGQKHFLLFPPGDRQYLYNGQANLAHPDFDRYPLLAKTRPLEATLSPGDMLFIPAGWAHQAISLSLSISLTFNFVNSANFMSFLLALSRDLPIWTKKINSDSFRKATGALWSWEDFEFLRPSPAVQQERNA
jgi:hypothetical protein